MDTKFSPPPYDVPQQNMGAPPTIVQQHIIQFGPTPQRLTCPSCHAEIVTTVMTEPSTKTHLIALLLCAFGCILCCCIPYCMDSCQSQKHNCPNCGTYLGTHSN